MMDNSFNPLGSGWASAPAMAGQNPSPAASGLSLWHLMHGNGMGQPSPGTPFGLPQQPSWAPSGGQPPWAGMGMPQPSGGVPWAGNSQGSLMALWGMLNGGGGFNMGGNQDQQGGSLSGLGNFGSAYQNWGMGNG